MCGGWSMSRAESTWEKEKKKQNLEGKKKKNQKKQYCNQFNKYF